MNNDSLDMFPKSLCPYESFVVKESSASTFEVTLGRPSEPLDGLLRTSGTTQWACLPAGNPCATDTSGSDHEERLSELKSYLIALGFAIHPVRTVPLRSGCAPQDGFLVLGVPCAQAVQIGSMLDQDAIAIGSIGMPASAVECDPTDAHEAAYLAETGIDGPALLAYLEEHLEDYWNAAYVDGLWVRESDVPDFVEHGDLELLAGQVDSDRMKAIEDGDALSEAEEGLWREAWIKRALTDWDSDCVPGYVISRVRRPGRQDCFVLILATGYSFSEIEQWIEGVFASLEEAMAYLSASGWHN